MSVGVLRYNKSHAGRREEEPIAEEDSHHISPTKLAYIIHR